MNYFRLILVHSVNPQEVVAGLNLVIERIYYNVRETISLFSPVPLFTQLYARSLILLLRRIFWPDLCW